VKQRLLDGEEVFVERCIRRQSVFLILSAIGVVVGLGLAIWWSVDGKTGHALEFVVVILILLNARNQLRQWRYAKALERLIAEKNKA